MGMRSPIFQPNLDALHRLFQPQGVQDPRPIGSAVKTGADLPQLRDSLEHRYRKTALLQGERGREAADAAASNQSMQFAFHRLGYLSHDII